MKEQLVNNAVNITSAVLAVLFPLLGTLIIFFIISPNIPKWYETEIKKPTWYPADNLCLFLGISMYVPFGLASYLIYRDGGGLDGPARVPLILYSVQLLLTWMWPLVFFEARSLKWGFYEVSLMVTSIATCCFTFKPINETAFYLILPYLIWSIFYTYAIYSIWRLNSNRTTNNKFN